MNPLRIIRRYYNPGSESYSFLIEHSRSVTKKALEVARRFRNLNPDLKFIEEAAMLHDIGIFKTHAPDIGCNGDKPYVCHGYLGGQLLRKEGLPRHALVCERHIGTGLTKEEINARKLPLPKRDMVPVSTEEKIICFADKFFSKTPEFLTKEKPIQLIKQQLSRFGKDHVRRFEELQELFG